jgi:hypothetical protein
MRHRNAFFANFILKFGEKDMIDYVEEIVLPAFVEGNKVRAYGLDTTYIIHKARLVRLGGTEAKPELGIAGQFIKNTRLVRHQLYDASKGPVADEAAIDSAPSSFFLLILSSHRLAYLPETPNAPDLKAFRSTMAHFLKIEYESFISKLHETHQSAGEKVSKKLLREEHVVPRLEIIALTEQGSISDFIDKYDVLKSIEFRIVKPNSELEGGKIFKSIRSLSDDLASQDTKLITASAQGLDKQAAKAAIADATVQGNQEVKLKGKDDDGNTLQGNNESFKIGVEIDPVPESVADKTSRLFHEFGNLIVGSLIKVPPPPNKVYEKIIRLMGLL